MEVWALYAYGAAHTLQEIITYKSDDVIGRVKVYESIIKGQEVNQAGVPESFRVLMKEFQALGLDVSIIDDNGQTLQLKEIEEAEDKDDFNTSIDEVESPVKEVLNDNNLLPIEQQDEQDSSEDDYEDEEDFEENEDFEPGDEDLNEDFLKEGADI